MNKSTLIGLGLAIFAVSTSAGLAAQRHHVRTGAGPAMKAPATEYGNDGYCGFPGCRGPMYQGAFGGGFAGGGPLNAIAGPYDAYAGPAPAGGFGGSAGGGGWTPGTTLNSDYEMYRRNKRDSGTE